MNRVYKTFKNNSKNNNKDIYKKNMKNMGIKNY